MNKPDTLNEEQAKGDLQELQKKYGALIVNFNNQQAELARALKANQDLQSKVDSLQATVSLGRPQTAEELNDDNLSALQSAQREIVALEQSNMNLQKKINKLQVEHVSEEEVDQLFYTLEMKEQQLKTALAEKDSAEKELMSERQMTARGTHYLAEPKYIEVHHNTISEDDDSDNEGAAPAS